mmetsp:Transcript_14931/g.30764  ORF Transcript_14931/g.30764 Transcript_14931/m.30764 type:complete len:357 (-) Transcript_14931:232-1302(-)
MRPIGDNEHAVYLSNHPTQTNTGELFCLVPALLLSPGFDRNRSFVCFRHRFTKKWRVAVGWFTSSQIGNKGGKSGTKRINHSVKHRCNHHSSRLVRSFPDWFDAGVLWLLLLPLPLLLELVASFFFLLLFAFALGIEKGRGRTDRCGPHRKIAVPGHQKGPDKGRQGGGNDPENHKHPGASHPGLRIGKGLFVFVVRGEPRECGHDQSQHQGEDGHDQGVGGNPGVGTECPAAGADDGIRRQLDEDDGGGQHQPVDVRVGVFQFLGERVGRDTAIAEAKEEHGPERKVSVSRESKDVPARKGEKPPTGECPHQQEQIDPPPILLETVRELVGFAFGFVVLVLGVVAAAGFPQRWWR